MSLLKIGILLLLALCSREDLKTKTIFVVPVLAATTAGMVFNLVLHGTSWKDMAAGVALGVVLYLLSNGTGGKVGKGDALIIACIGVCFGFWPAFALWWEAMVLLAAVGCFLIIMKHLPGRKAKLPFIPFLMVVYVINLCSFGVLGGE